MKARDTFRRLGWGSQGRPRRHPLIAGILVLVLLAQFGCASNGSDKGSMLELPSPPPGETALKVAVTSGRLAPRFDIGVDMAKGANCSDLSKDVPQTSRPSFAWREVLFPMAIFPLIIPLIFALPVLFLLAAGVEAITPEESVVERAERAAPLYEREATAIEIVAAHREVIQGDLRDRVVAIGRGKTSHTLTVLADRGPRDACEQPDYRPLSQKGIQAVLEVVVRSATLNHEGQSAASPLRLVMTVSRRLIRTVDNAELYSSSIAYTGEEERTLAEWIGDPEGFQNELNRAYREIAEKTVEEIFPRTESN